MKTILFALLVSLAAFVPPARAKLEFDAPRQKLDATIDDDHGTAVYRFRNTGAAPIRIIKVLPSCDCTSAEINQESFASGEAGTITVVFIFGDREGPQLRTVQVETDEPKDANYLLTLEAELPRAASVEPRALFWRAADAAATKTIHARFNAASGVTFLGAVEETKAFTIDVERAAGPLPGALEDIAIHIRPKSVPTEGDLGAHLLIHFTTPKNRIITYRTALRVIPPRAR